MLLALVLWFVGRSIKDNFGRIENIRLTGFDPKYMFFSVIVLFISLIFPVFAWKYLLHSLGEKINTLSALKVWFISNLGRYFPGKVLQFAGIVYFSNKEGVSKGKAFQSVLYSQITSNGLGLLMGLALLLIKSGSENFPNAYHLSLILIISFVAVIWFPAVFMRSSNFVLEKFKKEKIESTIAPKNYFIYIILQTANWLIMSLAFVLVIKSYTHLSLSDNPQVLLILPISWTLGLIAVFAPGGIGVREGSMSFWLSSFIPLEFALVLPWIYRILITISEIILTVIFAVSYRKPDRVNFNNSDEKERTITDKSSLRNRIEEKENGGS